ncbi:MAG: zf-HC2 domain-containing protein [Rhodobacteraceae bacterium]|nr:zf-HC2 domain-containing protein [Paracoccaceae bacterium]
MSFETVMKKTRLAAFADGELSPEEAAEVVMHLADHPEDQAYVDALMVASETLAEAFSGPMNEPVPKAIEQAILGNGPTAQIVPFRRRPAVWVGTALAASVAAALVAVPLAFSPNPSGDDLAVGLVKPGSYLARTLDTLPSGTPETVGEGREVMILATLPVDGGYCREIEVIDQTADRIDLGVACRRNAGWNVEVTLSEPLSATGTEDGFVAASGAEVQGLQPFLDRLGTGVALDPVSEADAIAKGWSR